MKGDRIERNLRERGPRELTGSAMPALPGDVEEAKARLRAIDRRRRVGTLVGGGLGTLAAAAAVVVVVVAATGSPGGGPGGGPGGSGSPPVSALVATPTPTAAPVATATPGGPTPQAAAPCLPTDLAAIADRWGAAAGSRGTLVTVTNTGATPCTLAGRPGARLENAGGILAAVGGDATSSMPQPLEPGGSLVTSVVWSNWCGSDPALPIRVILVLPSGDLQVSPDATGPDVLVPPCLGTSDRNHLSTIDFQPPSSP